VSIAAVVALFSAIFGFFGLCEDFVIVTFSRHAARALRAGRTLRNASAQADEFKAARDRIRRIQLGLAPDAPLPEEETAPAAKEVMAVPQAAGERKGELDLAEARVPATPIDVKVTRDVKTTDAADDEKVDAYSGTAKEVEELQPITQEKDKKKEWNFLQGLISDFRLVSLPSPGDVLQTFGIVLLLVALYTAFVAIVDYSSQQVLGQVFQDFYKAARPEAPSL